MSPCQVLGFPAAKKLVEAGGEGGEMAACHGWQSSYKDGRARVIFGNTAKGGGHELWFESFRLDVWEVGSLGAPHGSCGISDCGEWQCSATGPQLP